MRIAWNDLVRDWSALHPRADVEILSDLFYESAMNMKLKQLLQPATRRAKRQLISSANHVLQRGAALEPLENRQMMSLTVSLEVASTHAKSAAVTSVGQVVNLNVIATVTGSTGGANDGLQSLAGSFLGTATNGTNSVGGTLDNATPTIDYTANGAQIATSQDLNNDGYKDAGSNNNSDIAGFFNARAGGIVQDGTVSGNSQIFVVGTLTYTVTKLNYGQPTDINFRLRNGLPAGAFDAVWLEDGNGKNDQSGSVLVGSPVVINDPNLSVPPNPASIAGHVTKSVSGTTSNFVNVTVFLDNNSNGILDAGDTSQVTDSSGNYDFTGLAAGTYLLREVVPSGYKQTSPVATPTLITVSAGQNLSGQDFIDAATAAQTGSIAGSVTKVVNSSSSAFVGVTVYVDLDNSGTLNSGDITYTTGSTGSYSFSGLPAGSYTVRQVVPGGYSQTSPSNGLLTVTLTAGQNSTGNNFTDTAQTTTLGSIHGAVGKVVNGVSSSFSGVTVYADINNDGVLDAGDDSTTTDGGGAYALLNLPAGTYRIRQVIPSGYVQSSPTSSPTVVTLAAGDFSMNNNFTDTAVTTYTPGSIAGEVYSDSNKNGKLDTGEAGLSGITMFIDANKNGVLDSGEASTVTGSGGAYSFTGLAPGTYRIREVLPSGSTLTNPAVGYYDIVVQSNWQIKGENWGNSTATVTGSGSITGEVFSDANGSGKLDSGEVGIPGVQVYIDINKDGVYETGEPTTTTLSNGTYSFTGLAAGTYRVHEVLLSGDKYTSPATGYFDVVLSAGAKIAGDNFGNTGPITLSGNVFRDLNSNGTRDSGELGLSGWVVYVDLNNDGKFETNENNKTTDSSGNFSFVSLKAGTYIVRVAPKSGYTQTVPSAGYYTVTIAPGLPVSVSFGEH